jgi:hypothetical protein
MNRWKPTLNAFAITFERSPLLRPTIQPSNMHRQTSYTKRPSVIVKPPAPSSGGLRSGSR